jgi:hypothetical protein
MMLEEWSADPRSASAIDDAISELLDKIWYNRHIGLRMRVESGEVGVVEKETYPRTVAAPETVQRDIGAGALRSARRMEKRRGIDNLGPWDDFEWGMLKGKLSALAGGSETNGTCSTRRSQAARRRALTNFFRSPSSSDVIAYPEPSRWTGR